MAVVARILPEAGWGIKPVAAGSAQSRPSSEGRCIPRFQVYRMSAPDRPFAGVAFNKMRRPGSGRALRSWG